MERLVTIAAIASIAFAIATPSFAQGRFGAEAKERAADREERESIRKAEHPEELPAEKAAPVAPAQEAPAQAVVEPAPAAPAPAQ